MQKEPHIRLAVWSVWVMLSAAIVGAGGYFGLDFLNTRHLTEEPQARHMRIETTPSAKTPVVSSETTPALAVDTSSTELDRDDDLDVEDETDVSQVDHDDSRTEIAKTDDSSESDRARFDTQQPLRAPGRAPAAAVRLDSGETIYVPGDQRIDQYLARRERQSTNVDEGRSTGTNRTRQVTD